MSSESNFCPETTIRLGSELNHIFGTAGKLHEQLLQYNIASIDKLTELAIVRNVPIERLDAYLVKLGTTYNNY